MRELYLDNGNNEFKFADTTTQIRLNAFDDGKPAALTENARVRIKNDSGYLLEASASITNNQAVITSGQLNKLPVGSYLLELWDTVEGGTAIYPSDGFLRLQINENSTGISGGIISSITVDDFSKQFSDLSQKLKKEVSDTLALKGYKGDEVQAGAYAHNSVVRGANLGSSLTNEQSAAIRDGSFSGMYLLDYWTINSVNWRIVAFDYYYGTGDNPCQTHHVVVVPDAPIDTAAYDSTNTTVGGYVGSKLYNTGLDKAKNIITAVFGSGHILTHRNFLHNAATNGVPSGGAWYDSAVELMTEVNVYGTKHRAASSHGEDSGFEFSTVDKSQYPGFVVAPSLQTVFGQWFWLRDVSSASRFANMNPDGTASSTAASHACGIRPAFCIY